MWWVSSPALTYELMVNLKIVDTTVAITQMVQMQIHMLAEDTFGYLRTRIRGKSYCKKAICLINLL